MLGKICKVDGCRNILKIQDGKVCGPHRLRKFRHGDYNISPNWSLLKKGKPNISPFGYLRIFVDGKRVLHHRYVMEQHLGRKLLKNEKVHHINKIKIDNRIENLELMESQSEHIKQHHHKRILVDWSTYTLPKPTPINMRWITRQWADAKTECLVVDCNRSAKTRGLCRRHYTSYIKNS